MVMIYTALSSTLSLSFSLSLSPSPSLSLSFRRICICVDATTAKDLIFGESHVIPRTIMNWHSFRVLSLYSGVLITKTAG